LRAKGIAKRGNVENKEKRHKGRWYRNRTNAGQTKAGSLKKRGTRREGGDMDMRQSNKPRARNR